MEPTDLPKLIGKVILFNKDIDLSEGDYEAGMKARVLNVEDHHDHFALLTDFSEFEEHNKRLMTANYYDENHQPRLKFCETRRYPKDGRTKDYYDYNKPGFTVVEEKLEAPNTHALLLKIADLCDQERAPVCRVEALRKAAEEIKLLRGLLTEARSWMGVDPATRSEDRECTKLMKKMDDVLEKG